MKLTSVILTCKIRTPVECHMTMICIDCLTKFTNTDEYELIVVDPEPSEPIRDVYTTFTPYKHLTPSPDPDYGSCMNLGAKEAKGDYLVFLQNDVYVQEGWLPGLRQYIETGDYDVVYASQHPKTRQEVLDTYKADPFSSEGMIAAREAGLIMMTREIFDKAGGWGEGMSLLAEKDMYARLGNAGAREANAGKVFITHIMAGTNLEQYHNNYKKYEDRMKHDAGILNK